MGRIRLKRVEVKEPRCNGCYFFRPELGLKQRCDGLTHCEKRNLRGNSHNLRDLFICDDFRCQLDMQNFIFIKY